MYFVIYNNDVDMLSTILNKYGYKISYDYDHEGWWAS